MRIEESYYFKQVDNSGELVMKITSKVDKLQVAEIYPEDQSPGPPTFGFIALKSYISQNDLNAILHGISIQKLTYKQLNPSSNGSQQEQLSTIQSVRT